MLSLLAKEAAKVMEISPGVHASTEIILADHRSSEKPASLSIAPIAKRVRASRQWLTSRDGIALKNI